MLSCIIDENLELRFTSEKYVEELSLIVIEDLEYLQEWLPWATEDYSIETAKEFVQMNREGFARNEFPSLFIFLHNKLVGGIGFSNVNTSNKSVEIGYWLRQSAQGKGIVTKCCRKLLEFTFVEMRFKRVVIRCATENIKSQKIPERLGFIKEGTQRQSELLHKGFVDLIVYSMLKEEWENV